MKFNKRTSIRTSLENHPDATTNFEDEMAFGLDPLTDLYIKSASCLVGETKSYQSTAESNQALLDSIHRVLKIDPEFVLQLAVYCREELYLRSVPLVLIAEYANSSAVGSVPNSRKYISRCIGRADEIAELISYQLERNKHIPRKSKLPMAIKAGVADAFNKFDEYQFAKYNRAGAVTLEDALFMTHPVAKSKEHQSVLDKIVSGTLQIPETWEVMRSTGKMSWHDVINQIFNRAGKVNNYMAQIRNIRNCMNDESVTKSDMQLMCNMLADENAVKYSKQLPFRFLSAYKEILKESGPHVNSVLDALETAVSCSAENIPRLDGTTLIACDVSGSMETPISKHSSVEQYDIGIMLGMLSHKFCEHSITGMFGDIWKVVPMSKHSGILSNSIQMHSREGEVGYSTNGFRVIEYLLTNDIDVDRIMMFTDNQMWNSYNGQHIAELFIKYQRMHPDAKLYLFDLSGYGSIVIPQDTKNVCLIGGWSDKVFNFVKAFESTGSNQAIEHIKTITPAGHKQ